MFQLPIHCNVLKVSCFYDTESRTFSKSLTEEACAKPSGWRLPYWSKQVPDSIWQVASSRSKPSGKFQIQAGWQVPGPGIQIQAPCSRFQVVPSRLASSRPVLHSPSLLPPAASTGVPLTLPNKQNILIIQSIVSCQYY